MPWQCFATADTHALLQVTSTRSIILVGSIPTGGKSNSETAFGWRGKWAVTVYPFWRRTEEGAKADGDARHIEWARGVQKQLQPLSQGCLLTNVTFESADDAKHSFPAENWARIEAAKAKFDPRGLLQDLCYHRRENSGA